MDSKTVLLPHGDLHFVESNMLLNWHNIVYNLAPIYPLQVVVVLQYPSSVVDGGLLVASTWSLVDVWYRSLSRLLSSIVAAP